MNQTKKTKRVASRVGKNPGIHSIIGPGKKSIQKKQNYQLCQVLLNQVRFGS